MSKSLVIAVHPDDETLACAGTLLKHKARGDSIHWLLVTSAQKPHFSAQSIAQQKEQVQIVEKAYPFDSFDWLKLASTQLDRLPMGDVVMALRGVIERIRPQTVFIPHRADVHSDHRVVWNAANSVMKSFYMQALGVQRVLSCEVSSETDAAPPIAENAFLPQVFEDISETLERKLELMALFESEVHPEPGARSLSAIRALARYRGGSIGVQYAEAFSLVREIRA